MPILQATTRQGSLRLPRLCLRAAALILFIFGIWGAVPEVLKRVPGQTARGLAANFGWVRGDLWAEAALLSTASPHGSNPTIENDIDQSSDAMFALRAIASSPWRGDMWLLLARQSDVDPSAKKRTISLLQMSYFVAPEAIDLAEERLRLAGHVLGEETELRLYAISDVRLILRERPGDTTAIMLAYREADEEGRRAIRDALVGMNSRPLLP